MCSAAPPCFYCIYGRNSRGYMLAKFRNEPEERWNSQRREEFDYTAPDSVARAPRNAWRHATCGSMGLLEKAPTYTYISIIHYIPYYIYNICYVYIYVYTCIYMYIYHIYIYMYIHIHMYCTLCSTDVYRRCNGRSPCWQAPRAPRNAWTTRDI